MGTNTHNYPGVAGNFDPTVSFAINDPASGDPRSSSSIREAVEPLVDAVEHYRQFGDRLNAAQTITQPKTLTHATNENTAMLVSSEPATRRAFGQFELTGTTAKAIIYHAANLEIAVNATWANGGGGVWTQTDAALPSFYVSFGQAGQLYIAKQAAAAGTWADGAWFQIALFDSAASTLSVTGQVSGSAVRAIAGDVTADVKLKASTARSSATVGAGQAVAAGETWKDTPCFAWGRFHINAGAVVFDRGANIASVVYTGAGIYTVTLQTAAANLLKINVTAMDSAAGIVMVDSGNVSALPPTTTVFRILYFTIAGAATDPAGNVGGFHFEVKQG